MAPLRIVVLAVDPANFDLSEDVVRQRISDYLSLTPAECDRIYAAYVAQYPDDKPGDLLGRLTTDHIYIRNTLHTALMQADAGFAPVYTYVIDYETVEMDGLLRSSHGRDYHFVFDSTDRAVNRYGTAPELADLTRLVMRAWTNFAKTGVPNQDDAVAWPLFDRAAQQSMIINLPFRVPEAPGAAARATLDGLRFYDYDLPRNFV